MGPPIKAKIILWRTPGSPDQELSEDAWETSCLAALSIHSVEVIAEVWAATRNGPRMSCELGWRLLGSGIGDQHVGGFAPARSRRVILTPSGTVSHPLIADLSEALLDYGHEVMALEEFISTSRKPAGRRGPRPLGYSIEPGSLDLHVCPRAGALVRRIFAMARAHKPKSIARQLNAEGLRTRLGKPWTRHAVSYILRSAAYVGRVEGIPRIVGDIAANATRSRREARLRAVKRASRGLP